MSDTLRRICQCLHFCQTMGANKEFMWIYGAYKHDKVLDRGLDYCLTTPDTCVICIEKRKHSSLDISPRRDESVPVTPKVKCLKYRSSSIDTETEAWETSSRAEHTQGPIHTASAFSLWNGSARPVHQIFSVRATPYGESWQRINHRSFLDMCLTKTRAGKSRGYRYAMVFKMFSVCMYVCM